METYGPEPPQWILFRTSEKSFSPETTPPHACEMMMVALNEPDTPVDYFDKMREYGIYILDGGTSFLGFQFCPWCGDQLPPSLRVQWFKIFRSLGLENEDDLPPDLRDGTWWRERTRE